MARAARHVRRLTISTNGLKLLDENYVKALAGADARIVLSLDTFDDAVDMKLLGAKTVKRKLAVLDLLEKHDVTTTILPAIAAGLNDKDVAPLLALVLARPNVCSLEMHTLTFTGQGGVGFQRSARITTPDLHRLVFEATQGKIGPKDFVPSPLAHPLCYSICYVLMLDGDGPTLTDGYVPFTRFMPRARVYELLADSLYMQPRRRRSKRFLKEAMDELWAKDDAVDEDERDAILSTLKNLLLRMFPPGGALAMDVRQKIAERATKAIYIHSHMDEENFDVSRIMKCSIGVPEEDGSNIPTRARTTFSTPRAGPALRGSRDARAIRAVPGRVVGDPPKAKRRPAKRSAEGEPPRSDPPKANLNVRFRFCMR